MDSKKFDRIILKYILWIAATILIIANFKTIVDGISKVWGACAALVLGMIMAYILNLIMRVVERYWFPKSKSRLVQKSRRGCSILASILIIVALIILLVYMVVPELIKAIGVLVKELPVMFDTLQQWVVANTDKFPGIKDAVSSMELNSTQLTDKIMSFLSNGAASDMLNATISVVTLLTGAFMRFVIGFIFAIYLLSNKERLKSQVRRVMKVFGKERWNEIIFYSTSVANQCFSKFIIGQCTEAIILGTLCMIGMLIIGLPYAAMVGVLVGATALIPVMGAYIGAAVGAFMILTISPVKALIFLIFLVILQQIEGNVIYPKVVGTSIGLPGLWVLAAVTIGGGLGGVGGMLLGVPVTATVYKLVQNKVRMELKETV